MLFGIKVYGKKNIPKHSGFLIASNHQSNLDPLLIGVANYRPIDFMAKSELFRNKFFGFILRCVHVFPVKRGKLDLGSIKEAIARLENGGVLLLFPQGGRRDSIDEKDARAGVGLFACKAKVPIVPAFIKGSAEALPKGKKTPRIARVTVYFGSPIFYNPPQTYNGITEEVMLAVKQLGQKAN